MEHTLPAGHYWIPGYEDQYSIEFDAAEKCTNIVYSWNKQDTRGIPTPMTVIGNNSVHLYNRGSAWYSSSSDRYTTYNIPTLVAKTKKSKPYIVDFNGQREWMVITPDSWHGNVSYHVTESDAIAEAESRGVTVQVAKITRIIKITKPEVIVM